MEVLNIANELLINEQIRDKEVRVIDEDGSQLGIMPIARALELSEQKQLDLVKIAPQAKPPVCRLMDYGKYRFESAKKEKEARKNQKTMNIKEVRLSPTIEEHDIEVRIKNAVKFLSDGDSVKVSIRFRGRQLSHTEIGLKVMQDFADKVKDYGTVSRAAKMEGRVMYMTLTPKDNKEKTGKKAAQPAQARAEEPKGEGN